MTDNPERLFSQEVSELEDEEVVSPPWGSIPSEKYLVQSSDASSSEPPAEQRRKLIRAYIKAGGLRQQPASVPSPTPSQVSIILRPWRTLPQRHLALHPGLVGTVWLRTHYSPASSSDAAHARLLSRIEIINTLDDPSRILDDPALYDYGSDWRRIFDILPELIVFPPGPDFHDYLARIRKAEDALACTRAVFAGSVSAEDVRALPKALMEQARQLGFGEEEVQRMVVEAMEGKVLKAHVVNYIVVVDEEALSGEREVDEVEGKTLLVFVDAMGRVVKSKRVGVEAVEEMGGMWPECCWEDSYAWEGAVLGDVDLDGEGFQ